MNYTINSEQALSNTIGELRALFKSHRYLKLSVKTGKSRSLDQNAISHAWYEQLAAEIKDEDALGWKCFCKLNFGVPILRAEDEEFRTFYDASIKKLNYEQKLIAMKYLPVTSLMTKEQLSKYLEAMQAHFMNSVLLEFPSE